VHHWHWPALRHTAPVTAQTRCEQFSSTKVPHQTDTTQTQTGILVRKMAGFGRLAKR
jgi:hypothetical protein